MKVLIFLCAFIFISAQNIYSGKVIDLSTNEVLVGVNIQVKGLLEGTVTDKYGVYKLNTFNKNPVLEISYVGYKSRQIKAGKFVETTIKPDQLSSDIVYVYSEKYSPAQKIILNTIDRYNLSFKSIENFTLNSYAKQYFYFPKTKEDLVKDDSLRNIALEDEIKTRNPYVLESYKEVNWKKPNKVKTTVLKRNQGKVLPAVFNVFGGMDYQNIFDPNYNLENSPLNRDNFDEYFFSISDTTLFQGDSVFVVHAVHNDTSNHWKYDSYINKENYLLKHVKSSYKHKQGRRYLNIANFMGFGATNVTLQQDYSLVNDVLFPQNFVVNHLTKKSGTIRLTEEYTNYETNNLSLDIYFGKEQVTLDSDIDEFTDTTWQHIRTEPLSPHESKAYTAADSLYDTYTAWRKFLVNHAPSILFFDYGIGEHRLTGISDLYRFNPVEGHYLGAGFNHPTYKDISFKSKFGYSFGQKKLVYHLSADIPISLEYDINFKPSIFNEINVIDPHNSYSPFEQTTLALTAHRDKQSYFRNKGFGLNLQKRVTKYFNTSLFYTKQHYSGLTNSTTFSLKNNGDIYERNLQLENRDENEFGMSVSYKQFNYFKLGPLETTQFVKNGWDLDAKVKFEKNDSGISFKNIHFNALKDFRFGKTQLVLNAVVHYKGKRSSINSIYFPGVYSLTSSANNFHISGFKYYTISSFDYYSVGASLALHRLIKWFRPGTLYLNAMSFTGNNYGLDHLSSIKMLDKTVHHELGIAFKTNRLFMPIRFMANYNTVLKSTTYTIDFSLEFGD